MGSRRAETMHFGRYPPLPLPGHPLRSQLPGCVILPGPSLGCDGGEGWLLEGGVKGHLHNLRRVGGGFG